MKLFPAGGGGHRRQQVQGGQQPGQRNVTPAKIAARRKQINESIDRYMGDLDAADRNHPGEFVAKTTRLTEKIKTLREQMRRMDGLQKQLDKQQEAQISLTDPDSRAMMSQATGSGVVGYNVQVAVDTKHHLIIAHEVTNATSDRQQLSRWRKRLARPCPSPTAGVRDRGYFNGQQIKDLRRRRHRAIRSKADDLEREGDGRFDKRDFIYIAKDDEYQCPAGQRAILRYETEERGLQIKRYWSSECPRCPIKDQCTPSANRKITRWEHESVLDAMQRRLNLQPEAMTLRRCTVEHVFGTLKHWMGSTHFLTRRLVNVGTEMSLHVLAYNLKRVINILGISKTMKAISSMRA